MWTPSRRTNNAPSRRNIIIIVVEGLTISCTYRASFFAWQLQRSVTWRIATRDITTIYYCFVNTFFQVKVEVYIILISILISRIRPSSRGPLYIYIPLPCVESSPKEGRENKITRFAWDTILILLWKWLFVGRAHCSSAAL